MPSIDYQGLTNVYTYMGWQLITDPTSPQYKLREDAGMNFDSEGFGIIDGRYVIACCERYGTIGDAIDWTLANGNILKTIMGDEKSSSDPNNNGWGHVEGNSISIVEFVVDQTTWYNPMHANPGTQNCHPEWAGQISNYNNVGNYYTGIVGVNGFSGNIIVLKGQKYFNGNMIDVAYIGSVIGDFIYFNDNEFWRCKTDGTLLQILYPDKNIWVMTKAIQNISISGFNQNGNAGSGSGVAPNANVETAVQWMINKANTNEVTYSQSNRNLKNPNGTSYDCSSFVITGFYVGGFDANAIYTGDMRSAFEALGFRWIPGTTFTADQLVRGDILLKEGEHTQVYIGNNQDVNCGSTPARVQGHSDDNYGTGWDGVLRYAG